MEVYWIWLTQIYGIGPVAQRKLLEAYGSPEAVYHAPLDTLTAVVGNRGKQVHAARSLKKAEEILRTCCRMDIRLLTYGNPQYPHGICGMDAAPTVLYYRGRFIEAGRAVAIVGTRRCTEYGKRVAREAAEYMAVQGIPVVNGVSKGIEAHGLTACIKKGGTPIAVLGFGPDICYPAEHRSLLDKVVETGMIVSAFPPGTPAYTSNYPIRNHLLAAWIDCLLIVEAGLRSGVFGVVTAAEAVGRRVYAVPNGIYVPESLGCNQLIAFGRAKVYQGVQDILENAVCMDGDFLQQMKDGIDLRTPRNEDKMAHRVLNRIREGVHSIDDLCGVFPDREQVLETICMLEVQGAVIHHPGGRLEAV